MKTMLLLTIFSLIQFTLEPAANAYENGIEEMLSNDPTVSAKAITNLRNQGPAGLQSIFNALGEQTEQWQVPKGSRSESWPRLAAIIDQVAGQYDAAASRLYWYTDFEKAKTAAKNANKPILSLRMLGRLDEEMSCANSRFFRTILYANTDVSAYLREHYILHWQSVRPVPKVTIDFGNGRKVEQTITGNSIHYVLASDGSLVDGIPGLYGPQPFLDQLKSGEKAAVSLAGLDPRKKLTVLAAYHQKRGSEIERAWQVDLAAIGKTSGPLPTMIAQGVTPPTAAQAIPFALSKAMVEAPLLRALRDGRETLKTASDDASWAAMAKINSASVAFDARSRRLIESKIDGTPDIRSGGRRPSLLEATLANLAASVAEDGVRNEYLMHSEIHRLMAGAGLWGVDALNEIVYESVFLTPSTDPWLGLLPRDVYSALPAGGFIVPATNTFPAQESAILTAKH